MIGGVIFLVGLFGIIFFIIFRTIEIKKNITLFARMRGTFDSMVSRIYRLVVFGEIPTGYRVQLSHALHTLGHVIIAKAALTLRSIEHFLSGISRKMIARRPDLRSKAPPSDYLKTISPDKKKEDTVGKNTKDSV